MHTKGRAKHLYLWRHATMYYRRGQEASRAANQQSIHHVRPWQSRCSIEKRRKSVDVMETLQNHNNSRRQEITWAPHRNTIMERSWIAASKTSSSKCACTKKRYTQSDRTALERKNYAATLEERRYHRDQYTVVPNQGRSSNIVTEYMQFEQWKKKKT